MTRRVQICGDGVRQSVRLDGQDISPALRGATLELQADHRPRLLLDLAVFAMDVDVDDTQIVVTDAAAGLLVRLGWTPPEGP